MGKVSCFVGGRNVVEPGQTFSTPNGVAQIKISAYDPAERGNECKMVLKGV